MTAEEFTKRLKKRSQWWCSIEDPVTGAGARIPDPCGFNTATYQFVQRFTLPVNAQGIAGLRVVSPYLQSAGNAASTTNAGASQYQVTNVNAAASALNWSDGSTTSNGLLFTQANSNLASPAGSSLASVARPVSGCVYGVYTGTSLSDAGEFVSYAATGPGSTGDTTGDTYYRQLYGTTVVPIKGSRCAASRLFPQKLATWVQGGVVQQANADYSTFVPTDRLPNQTKDNIFREFGCYLIGGTFSTGSVDFVVVINYEFVPRFQAASFVSVAPSPVDPFEESFVLGQVDMADATSTVTVKQYSAVPSTSSTVVAERQEQSGPLSPLTEAVGFLGPILEIGLPLLGSLL